VAGGARTLGRRSGIPLLYFGAAFAPKGSYLRSYRSFGACFDRLSMRQRRGIRTALTVM